MLKACVLLGLIWPWCIMVKQHSIHVQCKVNGNSKVLLELLESIDYDNRYSTIGKSGNLRKNETAKVNIYPLHRERELIMNDCLTFIAQSQILKTCKYLQKLKVTRNFQRNSQS